MNVFDVDLVCSWSISRDCPCHKIGLLYNQIFYGNQISLQLDCNLLQLDFLLQFGFFFYNYQIFHVSQFFFLMYVFQTFLISLGWAPRMNPSVPFVPFPFGHKSVLFLNFFFLSCGHISFSLILPNKYGICNFTSDLFFSKYSSKNNNNNEHKQEETN